MKVLIDQKTKRTIGTLNLQTAVGIATIDGKKATLGFTTSNSTWTDWNMDAVKIGDEIEIPDDQIQQSKDPATGMGTGRYFISRLSAAGLKKNVDYLVSIAAATKAVREAAL